MTEDYTGSGSAREVAVPTGPQAVRPGLAPLKPGTRRAPGAPPARRVLIVGGGYVGLYAAMTLQRRLRRELRTGQVEVTVVDPRPYMTYQPFLPETAAGSLEARHVVVPLRRTLSRCTVLDGRLESLDHEHRRARIRPGTGEPYDLDYDVVVLAPGSISKTLPIPGLVEQGIGFKQVEEAVALRDHVLDRLDVASSTADPRVRARALTFVFIGGGYAGVEAFAELEDMARYATRSHANVRAEEMHWLLVEAGPRILGEVSAGLGQYTLDRLRERGMDIRLSTRLDSCVGGDLVLSDGTELASDTIVWTAGVKSNPVLAATGLDLDGLGRLPCTADLRVRDVPDAWSAGDCAAVPDLTKGDGGPDSPTCAPNAQHAVRQAVLLGRNLARSLQGLRLKDYRHAYVGSVASLGLYKGVAEVYGVRLKGLPAWVMHRAYHASRMPTTNRKIRVVGEWALDLLLGRDAVSLAQITSPRADFRAAAGPVASRALPAVDGGSGPRGGRSADQVQRTAPQTSPAPPEDRGDVAGHPTGNGAGTAPPDRTGAPVVTSNPERGPVGRPSPTEERHAREEGLPPKTTHDAEQDVPAAEAPDTPVFGDDPEPVAPADDTVSSG